MNRNRLKRLAQAAARRFGASFEIRPALMAAAERYYRRMGGLDDSIPLLSLGDAVPELSFFERFDSLAAAETEPVDWTRPEAVGWLYQFFSEPRRVRRRQGAGGTSDTAAATGLYTPDWIAAYLIDETVGRLLADASTADAIESITVLDPSCGCGHLLLAAYDRFERAYRRAGVPESEIPPKIVGKNLFGLDIDRDAVEVASRLLTLRTGLSAPVTPRLFSFERETFPDAEKLGSLWRWRDLDERRRAESGALGPAARLLARSYDAVVANPPYLGVKGMSAEVKRDAAARGLTGRGNLYTLFIERALDSVKPGGRIGMIAMQSWMFLSTFADFRRRLLTETTLERLAHFGTGAFPTLGGEVVATAAFTLSLRRPEPDHRPIFYRLLDGDADEKRRALRAGHRRFDCLQQRDFLDFDGAELLYHLTDAERALMKTGPTLGDFFDVRQGMATGDNRRFLRRWFEVGRGRIAQNAATCAEAALSGRRWFPYAKGEGARRWRGMCVDVIDWFADGAALRATRPKAVIRNPDYFFREALSWSFVATGAPSFRYRQAGAIFDVGASSIFPKPEIAARYGERRLLTLALGYLASPTAGRLLMALNPTTNFQVGDLVRLPFDLSKIVERTEEILPTVERLVALQAETLRREETSIDFTLPTLLSPTIRRKTLTETFDALSTESCRRSEEIADLERRNAEIFQAMFGLTPRPEEEVASAQNCRRGPKSESAFIAAERKKAAADLLSFVAGLAFGRYAIPAFFAPIRANGRLASLAADGFFIAADDSASPLTGALFETLSAAFPASSPETDGRVLAKYLTETAGQDSARTFDRYFHSAFWREHVRRFLGAPIYWRIAPPESPRTLSVAYHRLDRGTLERIAAEWDRAGSGEDSVVSRLREALDKGFALDFDEPALTLRRQFEGILGIR